MLSKVKVYIGDFKINRDSHLFIENWGDDIVRGSSFRIDPRIPVVDIDYLGLQKETIKWIVEESKCELILCTLYPSKIDTSLPCQITYKDHCSEDTQKIWDLVKECFHTRNRKELSSKLKESNVSLHVLNQWLQGNPTPENIGILKLLDLKVLHSNPHIWIDYLSLRLLNGPSYPKYRFKKKAL